MLEFTFLINVLCVVYFTTKYIRSLDEVLASDYKAELKNLVVFSNSVETKFMLMRDMKFYFFLIMGKYKASIESKELTKALDKSRWYLLMQYPFLAIVFIVPVIANLYT
ncbi:hypothetical protein [Pseudoalteromonas ardens]|uniref:hypothetical protein n=1 Tax=Pseudoalteromonas ardens TaxID=3048490 RepID=UPI0006768EB5|nr:hypothetical protein [Pseudoalteromonas sp. R96]MDK1310497.1 hypothetical protein [Pseudoalteromonas sp. R96]